LTVKSVLNLTCELISKTYITPHIRIP